MDIDKSERSNALSIKYLESRHQEALIAKDEDLRRQKVQVVLCREENAQHKDKIRRLLGRIEELEAKHDETVAKLQSAEKKSREQDGQLRAKSREHELLRTELQSLNSITQDSSKTLTEKLALSRELAMLKPEVEHLRSQVAHQKDVLAEKLALERQLNALEVELANEKRATQRALQRQANQDSGVEDELRQQIEVLEMKLDGEKRAKELAFQTQKQKETDLAQKVQDLEAKLAKQARDAEPSTAAADTLTKVQELEQALANEKRDSQRRHKAIETELSEARGQIEIYEQRLGDLKAKFRETRDALRSMRAEVAAGAGDKKSARALAAHATAVEKIKAEAKKKRRVEDTSGPEPILQTPHVDDAKAKRALKKRGFNLASIVEKSTFSITPLLNKTASLNEDSVLIAATANKNPVSAEAEEDNEEAQETLKDASADAEAMSEDESGSVAVPMGPPAKKVTAADSAAEAPKRRGRPPKENVLSEAAASKKNAKLPEIKEMATEKESDKTAAAAATTVFGDQENRPLSSSAALSSKNETAVATTKAGAAEPRKKKRKILGAANKTLFDGDEVIAGGIDSLDGAMDAPMVSRPSKPKMAVNTASAGAGNVKRTALGSARGGAAASTAAAGPAQGMAGAGGAKRNVLGGVRNAFGGAGTGGFSPLKRHRRGVNASFLA